MELLALIAAMLAACVLIAWTIASWIASTRIRREALLGAHSRPRPQTRVVEVTSDSVTLLQLGKRAPRLTGTWGLGGEGLGGEGWYGRVTEGVRLEDGQTRYRFQPMVGTPAVGETCALDGIAYPPSGTPEGMEDVSFPGPLGAYRGWRARGGTTWVIAVHGKSGGPRELLRVADAVRPTGCTVLIPFYRNDEGVPPSEDGYFHFGRSEWEDLEAAVAFALAEGAETIVMSGHSMGAAIVGWFLRRSRLAGHVSALVLDAPLLDFYTAVSWTARTTGVPAPVTWLGLKLGRLRFGLRWRDYDTRPAFAATDVPALILHGEADGQVPITMSERFVEARSGAVALHRFPDAGHGQAWNLDPIRYESLVQAFVRQAMTRAAAEHDEAPEAVAG